MEETMAEDKFTGRLTACRIGLTSFLIKNICDVIVSPFLLPYSTARRAKILDLYGWFDLMNVLLLLYHPTTLVICFPIYVRVSSLNRPHLQLHGGNNGGG
ncbi:hypothetical protein AVEN_172992-1 [Araneus ventricosus]|uniref:Uncharacterized protein n=1 Tax=Araneus ventricosus TaxID=182803 RepID=A0A4Y2KUQ3_ARAVE|nr:hypothetical protein AVEN_172992-1 [Araneus ventricosus]